MTEGGWSNYVIDPYKDGQGDYINIPVDASMSPLIGADDKWKPILSIISLYSICGCHILFIAISIEAETHILTQNLCKMFILKSIVTLGDSFICWIKAGH